MTDLIYYFVVSSTFLLMIIVRLKTYADVCCIQCRRILCSCVVRVTV